jgi:integral membrane protein (TIGR00529 family)
LSPSVALLISLAAVLLLLWLKLHPGLAVFLGSLILSLLILPARQTPVLMLATITSLQTLRLIGIIICALSLSKLMELRGLLLKLAHTLETIGPKLAMHVVPSVIAMVPMPAGALVSATALKDLARRLRLPPAQATYVNYWFRHLWELSIPVYPGVIAASVVLAVPLSSIVTTMLPAVPLMAVFGGITSYRILRNTDAEPVESLSGRQLVVELFRAAWPVLLLIGLVLSGIEAAFAFLAAGILLAVQQRASKEEVKQALRYGFGPRVLFLLYSVMLYKGIVEQSGAAYALFTDMQTVGMPPAVILLALPALVGFATGLSVAFVGISFPLLLPFMTVGGHISGSALFLAYVGGGVGYMLSPLHLCLTLSSEFFGARLGDVYRLMALPLVGVVAAALLAFLTF